MFLSFDLIDYLLPCSSVIHGLKHCLSELTKTNNYNEIADKTKTKINLKLKKHWTSRVIRHLTMYVHQEGAIEEVCCA